MTKFDVHGPFTVHLKKHGRGFRILYARFWKLDDIRKSLQSKRGIYVFGIRAGKGFTPIYVGRATGTVFGTECFNKSNLRKYRSALRRYVKCTPVLLLVAHPKKKGRCNKKAIDEIETFLIQLCAEKNPRLQNLRKRRSPHWSIAGVIRCSRKGPRKKAEAVLKKMAGLRN